MLPFPLLNIPFMIENLFSLTQLIHKPTRVTGTSSKCLDHILTSVPEQHILSDVAKICLSDHYLIYTCINVNNTSKNVHNVVRFRDYKNFDENAFIDDLKHSDVLNNNCTSCIPLREKWVEWKQAFLNCCNKHAPVKECCRKRCRVKTRHCPWMNSNIIKLIYKRDYLKKKYDRLKIPYLLTEYRNLRNSVTKLIRKEKRDYFDSVSERYSNDIVRSYGRN